MFKKFGLLFTMLLTLFCESLLSQGVTAITLNNMDFGDVYIGYSKIIHHTDAGAAKFRMDQKILGNPYVAINFTLPTSLDNGLYSIPVTFSSTTAAWSNTDLPTGRTNFDPTSTLTIRLHRRDYLYIWLGGNISVPTNSVPGIYSSTIIVTIEVL
jgi:hypothetical protein